MGASGSTGKGARKYGRNEKRCQSYLSAKRRIKNKTRDMLKRVRHYKSGADKIIEHNKIGRRKEGIHTSPGDA